MLTVSSSPAIAEPLSPFVHRADDDSGLIDSELLSPNGEDPLLVDLLRSPGRIAERVMDPQRLLPLITSSMAIVMATSAVFTFVAMPGSDWVLSSKSALSSAAAFVVATASAMAPIYGAALLLHARLPMARLTGALAAATATASLLLAAAAPFVMSLFRTDPDFAGPFSLVMAYVVAGLAGGARVRALLRELARITLGTEELHAGDDVRVRILSRVSLMMLWFTLSLAMWTFNVLGTR